MIGITRLARFAGLSAVPALLPGLSRAAWLGVMPEFNPFKYNSFPVNGARQSHLLCQALQGQIARLSRSEAFATLPPMLTFQSVLDYTVSTSAVLYSLYAFLPDNGSELLLYDVNRASLLGGLMRVGALRSLERLVPREAQRYTLTVLQNRANGDPRTMLIRREAGSLEEERVPLDFLYPVDVFSLSHGAIPFPMDDALYGVSPTPEAATRYGVNLGNLSIRGERGAFSIPVEAMLRMSANPFFPHLLAEIEEGIDDPRPLPALPALLPPPTPMPSGLTEEEEEALGGVDEAGFSGIGIF